MVEEGFGVCFPDRAKVLRLHSSYLQSLRELRIGEISRRLRDISAPKVTCLKPLASIRVLVPSSPLSRPHLKTLTSASWPDAIARSRSRSQLRIVCPIPRRLQAGSRKAKDW
jgi:hypothetical protein